MATFTVTAALALAAPMLCLAGVQKGVETKAPFTVADDISTVYFGDPYEDQKAIQYSPDHNYVAVKTSQGRLDLKRPEDSLRIYSSKKLEAFLRHGGEAPL